MRYLRMLSDSVLVGVVAAVYLTVLFLLLNPAMPLTFGATLPVLCIVGLSYGLALATLVYLLFVLRQALSSTPLLPAWVSLRVLAWASGVSGVVVGALLWLNASGYRTALGGPMMQPLFAGAVVLVSGGTLMLALALTRTFVQRARVVVGTVYAVIALTTVAVPLALRDAAPRPREATAGGMAPSPSSGRPPRVVVILLEAASLEFISPAVAAGGLPNFGRLLDDGASMHLATTRPTQPEPVWATFATGKWPAQHGIRGAATYHPVIGGHALQILPDLLFARALVRIGLLVETPLSSADLRATPLWHILDRQGVPNAVIGVPLAPSPGERPAAAVTPAGGASVESLLDDDAIRTLRADQWYRGLAVQAWRRADLRVLAVRYAGLDAVAHAYLRYAVPNAFGDVSDEERRQFGRVLDDYYGHVDAVIGEMIAALEPQDLLLVVSGFGMEPLSPGKRLLELLAGNSRFSGTHERAPDGFLLAIGGGVTRGRLPRGALVDVTPTLLYFLDEPVGRDMDGFTRTDLFTAAFNAQRTITVIPSYEGR